MAAHTPTMARAIARGNTVPDPSPTSRRGALAALTAFAAIGAAPAAAVMPPPSAEPDLALVEALRRSLNADRDWSAAMLRESAATDMVRNSRRQGAPDAAIARAEAEAARQAELGAAHEARWADAMNVLAARPAAGAIGLAAKLLPLREAEDEVQNALRHEEATLLASVLQDAERLLAGVLPSVPPRAFPDEAPESGGRLPRLAEAAIRARVEWHASFYPDAETEAEEKAREPAQACLDAIAAARRDALIAAPARDLAGCIAKAKAAFVFAGYGADGNLYGWNDGARILDSLLDDLLALGGTDADTVLREALAHAEGAPGAEAMFGLPAAGVAP